MTKATIIYTRVSTEEQSGKGHSLDVQRRECQAYAERMGFPAPEVIAEDVSGKIPLSERPAGRQLTARINRGEVGAVIVWRVDRLSRDLVDTLILVRSWKEAGIELHALDVGRIASESEIVLVVKAWQGGDEHSKIRERTASGRNEKARKGRPVMSGYPPYGYRREGRKDQARIFIFEPEAAVVKKIFAMYASGMSLRAIAIHLVESGEPTPSYRKNSAQYWIPATLRTIMKNELFVGRTYYGKSRIINKKRIQQPRETWIPIEVPELAFIPQDLFDRAQERLHRNKELSSRNRRREYLLSGFFRCGACKNAMAGSNAGAKPYKYRGYRCGSHWHKPDRPPCSNENRMIAAHIAEDLVWNWLVELLTDAERLEKGLCEMEARWQEQVQPRRERLAAVRELIVEAEKKMRRLVNRLGDEEDDVIAVTVQEALRDQARRKEALLAEAQEIEHELNHKAITPELHARITAQARVISQRLENPTYEQKRELLDLLDVKVVFRVGEDGRLLDVSCGIRPDGEVIVFDPLSASFPH